MEILFCGGSKEGEREGEMLMGGGMWMDASIRGITKQRHHIREKEK